VAAESCPRPCVLSKTIEPFVRTSARAETAVCVQRTVAEAVTTSPPASRTSPVWVPLATACSGAAGPTLARSSLPTR
jgi:hypothetical protein